YNTSSPHRPRPPTQAVTSNNNISNDYKKNTTQAVTTNNNINNNNLLYLDFLESQLLIKGTFNDKLIVVSLSCARSLLYKDVIGFNNGITYLVTVLAHISRMENKLLVFMYIKDLLVETVSLFKCDNELIIDKDNELIIDKDNENINNEITNINKENIIINNNKAMTPDTILTYNNKKQIINLINTLLSHDYTFISTINILYTLILNETLFVITTYIDKISHKLFPIKPFKHLLQTCNSKIQELIINSLENTFSVSNKNVIKVRIIRVVVQLDLKVDFITNYINNYISNYNIYYNGNIISNNNIYYNGNISNNNNKNTLHRPHPPTQAVTSNNNSSSNNNNNSNNIKIISPYKIISTFKTHNRFFDNYLEQDSTEFLYNLIGNVDEDLKSMSESVTYDILLEIISNNNNNSNNNINTIISSSNNSNNISNNSNNNIKEKKKLYSLIEPLFYFNTETYTICNNILCVSNINSNNINSNNSNSNKYYKVKKEKFLSIELKKPSTDITNNNNSNISIEALVYFIPSDLSSDNINYISNNISNNNSNNTSNDYNDYISNNNDYNEDTLHRPHPPTRAVTSNNNNNNDYNEDSPHRPHPPTRAVTSNNNNSNNNSNNNNSNNNNSNNNNIKCYKIYVPNNIKEIRKYIYYLFNSYCIIIKGYKILTDDVIISNDSINNNFIQRGLSNLSNLSNLTLGLKDETKLIICVHSNYNNISSNSIIISNNNIISSNNNISNESLHLSTYSNYYNNSNNINTSSIIINTSSNNINTSSNNINRLENTNNINRLENNNKLVNNNKLENNNKLVNNNNIMNFINSPYIFIRISYKNMFFITKYVKDLIIIYNVFYTKNNINNNNINNELYNYVISYLQKLFNTSINVNIRLILKNNMYLVCVYLKDNVFNVNNVIYNMYSKVKSVCYINDNNINISNNNTSETNNINISNNNNNTSESSNIIISDNNNNTSETNNSSNIIISDNSESNNIECSSKYNNDNNNIKGSDNIESGLDSNNNIKAASNNINSNNNINTISNNIEETGNNIVSSLKAEGNNNIEAGDIINIGNNISNNNISAISNNNIRAAGNNITSNNNNITSNEGTFHRPHPPTQVVTSNNNNNYSQFNISFNLYLNPNEETACKFCNLTTNLNTKKQIYLKTYPYYLIISFKRTTYKNNKVIKVHWKINIPDILYLNNRKYILSGLVNHKDYLTYNHYTSFLFKPDDVIYYCNDSVIKKVLDREKEIMFGDVYFCLFCLCL
ncbi:hypothetical protein CDIK_2067, partial [Cucumispora dikerogammari]